MCFFTFSFIHCEGEGTRYFIIFTINEGPLIDSLGLALGSSAASKITLDWVDSVAEGKG